MQIKTHLIRTSLAWGLLLILLCSVAPSKVSVLLLIVPFVLLFVALYNTCLLVAGLWRRSQNQTQPPKTQMAATFSAFLVLLVVIESLGQLNLKDVITCGLLFVLGYFYFTRWTVKAPNRP